MCVYVCSLEFDVHRGQKRTLNPLELELETVMSHPVWVLEIKLGSFARAELEPLSHLSSPWVMLFKSISLSILTTHDQYTDINTAFLCFIPFAPFLVLWYWPITL